MLEEQDVDIMAWAIGTAEFPERFAGPMIER
jgi:antitoxin CptB